MNRFVLYAFKFPSALLQLYAREFLARSLRERPLSGEEVAELYGLLVHYTRWDLLHLIVASDQIGNPGVWLSPTAYSACMAPYNLGLDSPRDTCLLVNVSDVAELWGPGTTPPSGRYPNLWQGGGIEFFCPEPIPFAAIERIVRIYPCGGSH